MSHLKPHHVLKHLRTIPVTQDPAFVARYVGAIGHEDRAPDEQSKLKFLGLQMPQVDQIWKQIDRQGLTAKQLLSLGRRATHHEELTVFMALLEEVDESKPLKLRELEPFIAVIDNWATSDQLSSIMARALEREGKAGLNFFAKWNRSKNPWMRRQSLVGLYYYARQRKRLPPPRFVLAQVTSLLDDPHFYVQKGLGWTLRELHNVEPRIQEAFVMKNLKRISSVAWFATSENYPKARKAQLARMRRSKA